MKHVAVIAGVMAAVGVGLAAWSLAGRMMTSKDDVGVVLGLLIMGILVGLTGLGVTWGLRKLFEIGNR